MKKILDQAKAYQGKLQQLNSKANEVFNNTTQVLDRYSQYNLPLAIPLGKSLDKSSAFQLALSKIKIENNGAKADVYMRIKKEVFGFDNTDNEGEDIFLAAEETNFTKDGGFSGETNLVLLGDISIKISDNIWLKLYAINPTNNSPTYVNFGCDGFKSIHISAALLIHSSLAKLDAADAKTTQEDGQDIGLRVDFETTISDLNDWIFEINKIPSFQFTSMPDFTYSIESLVYDKSLNSKSNSINVNEQERLNDLNWMGFYCKKASIKLPNYLKGKNKMIDTRLISQT
jgi:hypothetical protein